MSMSVEPVDVAYFLNLKENVKADTLNAAIWGVNQLIEDTVIPNLKSNADALYVEVTRVDVLEKLKTSPILHRYSCYVDKKWDTLMIALMSEFWHFNPQGIVGGLQFEIPLRKRL